LKAELGVLLHAGRKALRSRKERAAVRLGILGGGLQGCCTALALAERAAKVTLFDKNGSLLSRTAVANEGKIHLGYMYAGDPTLSTAKTMMAGAFP
jgi:glycine/D-amino acid oxidase-like deaminating enzyme